ncbi:hypothetical protein ACRRTK_020206 [Alexandromys fortis]
MATVVVEATEPEPSGSIANPAASTSPSLSHRFLDSKFYLLVVVGETVTEEHLRRAIGNIELGIRSWDTNLIECNLDQELKLFVSRHSARFSPEVPDGGLESLLVLISEVAVLMRCRSDRADTRTRSRSHEKAVCSSELLELCDASCEERGLNFSLAHLNQFLSAQLDNRVRDPNSAPGLQRTATRLT